ncbi:Lrp/AsnC ligand binding domain-containing protein [Candidatus Woesearchaeota archaeon]|nr:Lrp/AsnC ligand binding domain-containing protein [Candidatus Woesearchaeota archaeon]
METSYILIKTIHGKLKIVSSKLKTYEEAEEVHEIYGRYDIIAKIVVESRDELKKFIQNKILILEGISSTESLVVFDDE